MFNKIIESTKNSKIFREPFELIDSGFSSGEENMRIDFERTILVSEGNAIPMFRLYGWEPWCVSLGANQKESDILKARCEEKGFDIVRRPTGGRAVLHANEITYSVVLPMPEDMTIHDIYYEIHLLLLNALKNLGCKDIDFAKAQPDFRDAYKRESLSVACFASTARYEIESQGKKIVGSAQRLFGNTLLQHGSILIKDGHEQLAYVSNVKNEDSRKTLQDYILKHSTTIEEISGREVTYEECSDAIIKSLTE